MEYLDNLPSYKIWTTISVGLRNTRVFFGKTFKNQETQSIMSSPYRVSAVFRFCYRNNLNNIGIDQKVLSVSGETEDYVIAALAVAFPERDCFSIVSLSWK
jgi:hypothetical protein